MLQPAKAQSYDYNSDLFDCAWLKKEYDRIIYVNENPQEKKNFVLASLLAAPLILIEKMLGIKYQPPEATSIGGSVDFSGSVHDIGIAARKKNCYQLYDSYFQAKSSGELNSINPAPAISVLPK